MVAEKFPEWMEDRRPQIWETKVTRRINKKEIHIRIHHMKLQNTKDKEVLFKTNGEEGSNYPQKNNTSDFSEKQEKSE